MPSSHLTRGSWFSHVKQRCKPTPEGDIRCPYCAAINPSKTTRRTTSLNWSLKFVQRKSTTTQETRSIHIKCILCKREYDFFEVEDPSWLLQHLSILDSTLQAIKTIYAMKHVDLDALFQTVTVLTRPSRDSIHIFFELYDINSFLACAQKGSRLIGVSFQRT
jgi:hypothetical protein